jgi:hypothetical protein
MPYLKLSQKISLLSSIQNGKIQNIHFLDLLELELLSSSCMLVFLKCEILDFVIATEAKQNMAIQKPGLLRASQ